MKKLLASIMVVAMILTAAPFSSFAGLELDFGWLNFSTKANAASYSGTCGDNLTWSFDGSTGELVISGTGDMDNYTANEAPWYDLVSEIKLVVIPYGITSIGDYAFAECSELASMTIPDTVTVIGDYAFSFCEKLEDITVGNGVTHIGVCAFEACGFKKFIMPDSVTTVGERVFEASLVTEIKLSENLTAISDKMFYYSTLGEITIPDSVTSIGVKAFYCCGGGELIIPGSVKEIKSYAFDFAQFDFVRIEYGVWTINTNAFCNTMLSKIVIPQKTSLDTKAFGDTLRHLDIYYEGTERDWSIYAETDIVEDPQYLCVHYLESEQYQGGTCGDAITWDIDTATDSLVFKGTGTMTDYVNNERPWYDIAPYFMNAEIGDGITDIGANTFYNCENLKNITIPGSIEGINKYAFGQCKNLTNVITPDSIKWISECAFSNSSSLKSITIGSGLTTIGKNAFRACEQLADVYYNGTEDEWNKIAKQTGNEDLLNATIHFVEPEDPYSGICGDSITWSIDTETKTLTISGQGAMYDFNEDIVVPWQYNYGDFNKIVIEAGVTHIGASSFAYCDNVTDISIPDSVITIGIDAFYNTGYYNDKNNWKNGVLYIGNYLIEFNSDVPDLCVIPEGILAVADYADKNEEKTVKFILPDSFISIGECAFVGPEITIPVLGTNVKYFSNNAFYDVAFVKVELSSDIEELNDSVFEECSIECLTFSNTLKTVGNGTFMQCACGDVYYLGTEEEWNQIVFGSGNEMLIYLYTHNTGCVHFLGSEHKHSYSSEITTPPTGEFEGTETLTCICGDHYEKSVAALGFDVFDGVTIDFSTNTISGFNAGETSLDSYTMIVNDSYTWEYETSNGKLGTGSKAILKDGDTVIGEYTILVYGDTNGDSWYDGQDAIIVDCLANGMLTQEDVGEAVYTAADCNHDGVIDEADVALLNEAGMLLTNVDQTKPAEVLLETSAEYVEYLDLIDQSPEIDEETDTDTDTSSEQNEVSEMNIIEMIFSFIKSIIETILSYIPVPLK